MNINNLVVTGITSFIGMHLARTFIKNGHRVIGTISRNRNNYDVLQKSRIDLLERLGVDICHLDLTQEQSYQDLIKNEHPDIWIHHAGWALNYASPDYDLTRGNEVNVIPLEGVYRTLIENRCKGVIITGSSAEYSSTASPCEEDDACWPDTPYGLSKLTETVRARHLSIQYDLPTRIARVFIPYGPFDAPKKLIPNTIDAIKSGESIELSPCEQKRDFLYIEDLIFGYHKLMEDLSRNTVFDIFNICSGVATPLRNLLYELAKLLKADPTLLRFGAINMRPGESEISYGSNKKAERLLGWKPRTLHEGLFSYLNTIEEDISL